MIITPSDLVEVTCFRQAPFISRAGGTVILLSRCREPISMNSVLVMFSVSLLAFSHSLMLDKSRFNEVCIDGILVLAYVRCVSSAYMFAFDVDKQLGKR